MLGIIGTLLGFVPGLLNIATTLVNAHFNAQVQMYMAKTGATKDVAIASINAETSMVDRWWFIAILIPGFALPFVIYTWKVVVWDIILGLGTTDPINGTVGWIYTTVVASLFLHAIADNVFKGK